MQSPPSSQFAHRFKGRATKVPKGGLNTLLIGSVDLPLDAAASKINAESHYDTNQNPEIHRRKQRLRSISKQERYQGGNFSKQLSQAETIQSPNLRKSFQQSNSKVLGLKSSNAMNISQEANEIINISNIEEGRYRIGKYLKLDQEAKRHLKFLQSLKKTHLLSKK